MKQLLLPITAAVLFAADLPNQFFSFGSPVFGLIALIPLYIALHQADRLRTAAAMGALYGATVTLLAHYWLGNFGAFAAWTLGGPVLGYTVYNTLLAMVLYSLLRLPGAWRPPVFAAAWTGYELLKGLGYLGFPWGYAAYSFSNVLPLMQIADITGVYGLSFIIVYANAACAELLLVLRHAPPGRHGLRTALLNLLIAVSLFAGSAMYGQYRLQRLPEPDSSMQVLLIQQNSDPWQPDGLQMTLATLQRLSQPAVDRQDIDLIVWSESSLPVPYQRSRSQLDFIQQFNAPLLTGNPYIPHNSPGSRWNAVILIDPDSGTIVQRYGKRRLVPFAEHIPLWETAPVNWFFREIVGLRSPWTPADEVVVFEIPVRDSALDSVRIGVPISFEGSFAVLNRDFVRSGADLLLNLTNNSWSQTESAQYQQFAVTRFRAIEARRPLGLATISGLTSTVDISGRLLDSLPMFQAAALLTDIPLYTDMPLTPYHRFGNVFAWAMLLVAAVLLILRMAGLFPANHSNYTRFRRHSPDSRDPTAR